MLESVPAVRRPVAIDLFSGAGGLSLGFESAGFDILSAIEYDPIHAATHLYNFPLTDVLCADIANVTPNALRASARKGWKAHNPEAEWDGVIDAVVGGPSCQGFSTMGRQDLHDERNQLVLEFVRIVCALKPRSFCMENVPGFLDPRFDSIRIPALRTLRKAGYKISGDTTVLHSEDYGVPQKRRRVLILGVLDADAAPGAPSAVTPTAPHTVDDAFEGLPQLWRYGPRTETDAILLSSNAQKHLENAAGDYIRLADSNGDGSGAFGHARVRDRGVLTGYRTTIHSEQSIARFRATLPGKKEPISRSYRLSPDAPSLTLRAGTGRERGSFSATRPLHPNEPRVITVREAARLHSFPDWFRFHTTNWHANRQIGNAVPPLLARAAGAALLSALKVVPAKSVRDPIELGAPDLLTLNPTAAAKKFVVAEDQVPKRRRAGAGGDEIEVEGPASGLEDVA